MRFSLAATLLVLTASLTFAQNQSKEKLGDAASATTVGHDAGVMIQRVILSGKWGKQQRYGLPSRQRNCRGRGAVLTFRDSGGWRPFS